MPDNGETVTDWIRANARNLTTVDPRAPLGDLEPLRPLVSGATVVGLGGSTRGSHELTAVMHRLLRFLIEEMGFRSLAIEMDGETGARFDEHVRTGRGDPRALLAAARPMWRTEEMLAVVGWLRSHAERHPADPVRFVGVDDASATTLAEIEKRLAENLIGWQERTGHRVVYWGGSAHTANGPGRTASGPPSPTTTDPNAGSYLRDHLGPGYVSVGLTFDHGSVLHPVPPPPADFADSPLGAAGLDAYLLDLHAPSPASGPVRAWLDAPAKVRLIGPHYDPDDDAAYHLTGGSLGQWFDVVVHVQQATPVHLLA